MRSTRRAFIKAGALGAGALVVGCNGQTEVTESKGVPPAAAAADAKKTVEFRCKGTFGFVKWKEKDTPPVVAVAKATSAMNQHFVSIAIAADALPGMNAPSKDWATVYYKERKFFMRDTPISALTFGPSVEAADVETLPGEANGFRDAEWCPTNGSPSDDARWLDARSVFSLNLLYGDNETVGSKDGIKNATFSMEIPSGSRWFGRAPRKKTHQEGKWQFKRKGTGAALNFKRAITDTIGFKLKLAADGTLALTPGIDGAASEPVKLDLSQIKDEYCVRLIAAPETPISEDIKPGFVVHHTGSIYSLFESKRGTELNHLPVYLEKCSEDGQDNAGLEVAPEEAAKLRNLTKIRGGEDIFCPGGEGGGG